MSRSELQPCGTYGAWQRHRKKGETPCEPCHQAKLAYQRAYGKIVRRPLTERRKALIRARRRAMTALAARYPEAFRALLEKEKAKEGLQ